MSRVAWLGMALAAILLTGCSKDVIIRGESGVVNVGTVTAELANVKMSGKVGKNNYELGTYPIAAVTSTVRSSWSSEGDTSLLQKDMSLTLETVVTYTGTKNTVAVSIDTTNVSCPKGFMLGTCMSQIEATQENLIQLYREKFSYLK